MTARAILDKELQQKTTEVDGHEIKIKMWEMAKGYALDAGTDEGVIYGNYLQGLIDGEQKMLFRADTMKRAIVEVAKEYPVEVVQEAEDGIKV